MLGLSEVPSHSTGGPQNSRRPLVEQDNLEQCRRRIAELEDELSGSERRWRSILEYLPQIGVSLDAKGRIVFANRHLLELTGWTLEEVRGQNWFDLFLPEDARESVREVFRATMGCRDVGPHSCHTNEIVARDGRKRTVSWFNVLISDSAGNVRNVTSLGVDLTAQEEAREAAQISEERLKLALDAADDSVWDLDCETREVFVSPQQALRLGYAPESIPGTYRAWAELVHPDDGPGFEEALWAAVDRRESFERELRFKSADGGWQWVLIRGKVADPGEGGGAARMVGTLQVIHGRKTAEEELRRAKMAADLANSALKVNMAHLRALMETLPELVWVKDADGVFLFCNPRFERLYGAREADIVGHTDYEFVDAELADFFREHDRRAMESGQPCVNEERVTYNDDGHTEYLETIKTPLFDDNGRLIGVLGVARDITERKRDQDALREAKEQAEAFSRSKTEFLTNMSHEIRTPLNGIMGMLQLMQSTGLSAEQAEYTGAALQSTRRLMNLLTDILDLSRVEAGKLVVREAPFDLVEVCEQVCDLFKVTSAQSGVALACELGRDVPRRVVGDAVRLQQVLTNLLGNAFKFTTEGTIAVAAHRLPDTPLGDYRILFTVADTGEGIPDHKVGTLFEAFTQVSEGYTRRHQGAGLGLSICRNLVTLMGGAMAIESEEGTGSTLYVSLPFGVGPEAERSEGRAKPRTGAGPAPLSILLAEDERVNSMVMKRILEKAGHTVVAVENGGQALETLRNGVFDVVLMDIQMPVMDGVEAARAIRDGRAGKDRAAIPIVAVTAYAMVGDREKFLKAGMDGYVVKPIEVKKLEQVLAEVCPGRAS
jgi:PAS domain S-box-containing protein